MWVWAAQRYAHCSQVCMMLNTNAGITGSKIVSGWHASLSGSAVRTLFPSLYDVEHQCRNNWFKNCQWMTCKSERLSGTHIVPKSVWMSIVHSHMKVDEALRLWERVHMFGWWEHARCAWVAGVYWNAGRTSFLRHRWGNGENCRKIDAWQ
jgi:hypothetical protein